MKQSENQGDTKNTPSATPPDAASLEKIATDWVYQVVAGGFEQAAKSFDAAVSKQFNAAKLMEVWSAVIAQVGMFKNIKGTKTNPYGAYTLVFVTCNFDKAALDVQLSFDAEKKIAGLFFNNPSS